MFGRRATRKQLSLARLRLQFEDQFFVLKGGNVRVSVRVCEPIGIIIVIIIIYDPASGQWGQTGCPRTPLLCNPLRLTGARRSSSQQTGCPAERVDLLQRDEHVGCPPRLHRNNNIHNTRTWFDTHTHTHSSELEVVGTAEKPARSRPGAVFV